MKWPAINLQKINSAKKSKTEARAGKQKQFSFKKNNRAQSGATEPFP